MIIKCKICNYETENRQSFNSHIAHAHHLKSKEYYDMFLKTIEDGICLTCGKPTKFRNMWYGYNKHCCTKCIPLDINVQLKMKETCQEKYGTDYAWQAEETKNKIKQTTLEHFGVECYLQTKECRKIVAENSKSEEIRNKIKKTTFNHYGVEYSFQAKEVKEKIKNTTLKRYGVENAAQSIEVRRKAMQTATSNGKRSSLELYLKQFFIKNNISYIEEYKDERYPYHCDFYLPTTDIFIEINGFWHHGGHWFNKNSQEDQEKLAIWQEKSLDGHPQYTNAIKTWTKKDLEKREYAIKNNLNYVVLWNKEDINNWINYTFI